MRHGRGHRSYRALVLALVLSLAGAPAWLGAAPSRPRSPLIEGRPARLLIGGWCIAGAYREPDWLVAIEAAGFDYVQNLDHHFAPGYGIELLRLLDSLHVARPGFALRAIIASSAGDSLSAPFTAVDDASPRALAAVRRTLAPGGEYGGPSLLGVCLWDEPCTRAELDRLGRLARSLRSDSSTAGLLMFTNLHPIPDAGGTGCGADDFAAGRGAHVGYAAYLDAYLSQFDSLAQPAPVLSFDHYPFVARGAGRTDFRENLALANQRARAFSRPGLRVPLWVVVQLGRHRGRGEPYADTPTFAQTRRQVWEALAHGAKGISYWTIFPTGAPEGPRFDFGAWDEAGRPGPDLPALAALNRELHALGPTLMELDAVGTYEIDGAGGLVPDAMTATAGLEAPMTRVTSSFPGGEALIGILRHHATDETYLLAVNRSLDRAVTMRLDLAAAADSIVRIDPVDGRDLPMAGATSRLEVRDLQPAGGALFRLTRTRGQGEGVSRTPFPQPSPIDGPAPGD